MPYRPQSNPDLHPAKNSDAEPISSNILYRGTSRGYFWLGIFGITLNFFLWMLFLQTVPYIGLSIAIISTIIGLFFLVLGRLRNLGVNLQWVFLIAIPIANLFVVGLCLVCPEGFNDTRKLDKSGRILAVLLVVYVIVIVIGSVMIAMRS